MKTERFLHAHRAALAGPAVATLVETFSRPWSPPRADLRWLTVVLWLLSVAVRSRMNAVNPARRTPSFRPPFACESLHCSPAQSNQDAATAVASELMPISQVSWKCWDRSRSRARRKAGSMDWNSCSPSASLPRSPGQRDIPRSPGRRGTCRRRRRAPATAPAGRRARRHPPAQTARPPSPSGTRAAVPGTPRSILAAGLQPPEPAASPRPGMTGVKLRLKVKLVGIVARQGEWSEHTSVSSSCLKAAFPRPYTKTALSR